MKLIQILFFVILLGCNNTSSADKKTEENATTVQQDKTVKSNSESEPGFTTEILDPVTGGPAEIELNINGAKDAGSFLIGFFAESHFRADSADIKNGKVTFKSDKGYSQGLYFISLPTNEFVQIILGEDQKFSMTTSVSDLIGSMQVKGSKENEIFYKNLKFEESYNPKFQELNAKIRSISDKSSAEYKAAEQEKKAHEAGRQKHLDEIFKGNEDLFFVQFKKAGQNPVLRENVSDEEIVYFYRKEFWDNVDFTDRRLIRTPVINNKLKRYLKELTPQNPDSIFKYSKLLIDKTFNSPEYYKFFTNWIAIQFEPTKCQLMDPEAVFVNMVQNYFTRERAFWADSMEVYALQQRAHEMGQSLVGLKGPDVISTDQHGNTKSIYEKTADYVIVYLYNPTCEHCMKETPLLVDWYNKWKNKGGDVFAIAIDTNDKEWKDYIAKNNMTFTNVHDPSNRSIYAKYYVDITPEVYILNKDREIIGKNLKVHQIETIINRDKEGS